MREIEYVGRRRLPCATRETLAQSATPNVCNRSTPALIRRRGVEDAAPYGRSLNVRISITVSRCAIAANFLPPLGSPERGAVAALCAVTEGLAQRWCGETTLPISRGRAGVEARPYEAWGGGRDAITLSVDRRRGERGDGVARGNDAVCRPTDGAPGTVRPTRRDVTFSNKSTSSVIQRKGRRGRRPLRVVR